MREYDRLNRTRPYRIPFSQTEKIVLIQEIHKYTKFELPDFMEAHGFPRRSPSVYWCFARDYDLKIKQIRRTFSAAERQRVKELYEAGWKISRICKLMASEGYPKRTYKALYPLIHDRGWKRKQVNGG